MICELNDASKVKDLFAGMEDSLIRSCLQGVMGKVYVTGPDRPRSAMAFLADFAFYAGAPDRALVEALPADFVIMVPQSEDWARLMAACYPDAAVWTRYAIRKDTVFDREKLQKLAAALPAGYEIRRIDAALYDKCLENGLFQDGVKHFGSPERYLALGRGFAALKGGEVVSMASSYTVYREGVEIEIDTAEPERRKGLASAVGAALILSCLDDGLYPNWDAANRESVRLAEKLGYRYSHEYVCYAVSRGTQGA